MNALIVDDEPLAHEVILHHLKAYPDIKVSGQCLNATQALSFLANNPVDLLFLDINMPELTGIDMLKVLANMPQVIIVSAYQEYALQGFELDVTDYLLKPVSAERLNQALKKVRERHRHKEEHTNTMPVPTASSHIILKVDRSQRKFELSDIMYLEAYGNYVKLWQADCMVLVSSSLKQLLDQLPSQQFIQVHKSFVINRSFVTGIDSESVTLKNHNIVKVGKSFKSRVATIF